MSGKRAKKIRKQANRHGGDGRGFSKKVAKHPEDIEDDLAAQERRRAEREGPPLSPEPKLEVLPGVPHRNYVPALGRLVTGPELTAVLLEAEKKKPTFYAPNPGRKPKPWQPAGGTEFAHGQLRYDGFLAMRWGLIEGLPSPNGVLDSILRDFETAFKAEYGEGYIVEAVCLHMPNPNLEAELKKLGWRGTVSKEPCDKLGRNNVHLQVYVRRLADPEGKQLVADITLFTHATDSVISSMQLRQLNVDLDEHRETKLENDLEKKYLQGDSFRRTGQGREGRQLPPKLREKVDAGKMDLREAIAKAIATDLKKKRKSFAKAKEFTSVKAINSKQVARYEKAKAFDLWMSKHFTTELDKRLRALHPRYGELLDMAPAALREVKQIQMDSKHKLLFNEALTQWERKHREAIQRKKDEEKDAIVASLKIELAMANTGLADASAVIEELKLASDQHARDHQALLEEKAAQERQLAAAVVGSEEAAKLKAEMESMSKRLSESEKHTAVLEQREAELQASMREMAALKSRLESAEAGSAESANLREQLAKGQAEAERLRALGKDAANAAKAEKTELRVAAALSHLAACEDMVVAIGQGVVPNPQRAAELGFVREGERWWFRGKIISHPSFQERVDAFVKSINSGIRVKSAAKKDETALIEKGKEIARAELAGKIEELQTQICDRDIHIEELERVSTTVATDHLEGIVKGFAWMRENPGKPLPDDLTIYFDQDTTGVRLNSVWQRVVEAAYRSEVADTASRTYAERIFACQEAELAGQFLLSKEDSVASAVALVRLGRVDELSPLQKSYFEGGFGLRDEVVAAAKVRLGQMQKQLLDQRGEVQQQLLKDVVEFASMPIAERAALFAPELSDIHH